jgi:hypothetical protein
MFRILARLCCRWFKFKNVFHVSPYAATGGGRATFVRGIVEYHAVDGRAAAQRSNFDGYRRLGSALDQEHRELAEQIRIDQTYIGEQSGDFKLPDGGAVGSGSTACSAKVALLIARLQNLHCRFRFGPRLKNRVAGKGDVRRIGMRRLGAVLRQGIQDNVKCGYQCVSKILSV